MPDPRLTVPGFVARKQSGPKLTMLTAYDFPLATLVDAAGIDAILVGDSLAMVIQGHDTTLPVTLDEIIYHAEIVGRAARRALIVVDLPFPTNHLGVTKAIESAGRILKETGCQAVKLEGGADQADVITALTSAGIPVMAHVGLRPQNVHVMGGYKVPRNEELLRDAVAAQNAGAFSIVLECVPAAIAQRITSELTIPTIGIGAGNVCDGQVLVLHDMLGLTAGHVPKFVKPFAKLRTAVTNAVRQYIAEVQSGEFPETGIRLNDRGCFTVYELDPEGGSTPAGIMPESDGLESKASIRTTPASTASISSCLQSGWLESLMRYAAKVANG